MISLRACLTCRVCVWACRVCVWACRVRVPCCVHSVMVDVWWGVVERTGPRKYNWTSYLQLVDIVDQVGLKIQFVTSFRTPQPFPTVHFKRARFCRVKRIYVYIICTCLTYSQLTCLLAHRPMRHQRGRPVLHPAASVGPQHRPSEPYVSLGLCVSYVVCAVQRAYVSSRVGDSVLRLQPISTTAIARVARTMSTCRLASTTSQC